VSVEEHDGLETVGQQLRQRYVRLNRFRLGGDVLLVALGVSLLVTVLIRLIDWPVALWQVYGVLLAVTLGVYGVLAWRVRLSTLAALIAADRVQGFQERLSTAYEYVQCYASNPFLPALLRDAEKSARRVEVRVVFPLHLPRRLWGIPFLLAALVGFTRLEVTPLRFDDYAGNGVTENVRREGKRLERWGHRLEQLAQQEQLDRSLVLARHLQNLGRRMQREGGEKGEVSERISTLSQYLQRMQQELRGRTLMSEAGLTATQDVLASGKSIKQELQDILKLLQHEVLPGESKQLAEQGIQRLSRQVGQNSELERLLQDLQAGNLQAARQLLQDIIQQQQAAEEMEHLERARRALQYSSRTMQREATGETSEGQDSDGQTPTDGGGSFEFGEDMMGEDMPGMEDFTTPGLGEDYGFARHHQERQNQPLRESEQPVSEVQVKSGEGAMRLGYVRRLPLRNEARVAAEQAVAPYQRAAEEVLRQEQIPRGYREQIKQYFLAIGIVPESKQ
jgi:hypothetical protein